MRKMSLLVLMYTVLAMFVITGFPQVGECAEYEMNTDRPGMDYNCYDLPADDITAGTSCKSDCEGDSKCVSWTYVKPNTTNGPNALCCKKSDVPAKKVAACCISGVKPCPPINVSSPVGNQTYYVNKPCTIKWNTSNIKNHGTVFLYVVQYDAQHRDSGWEGGGFPVSNTGSYQWVIPANVGPMSVAGFDMVVYAVKIVTPDKRCVGQSGQFLIKKKLSAPLKTMQRKTLSP